ncbi:fimbria/pilus periplasmic chaperone [uncultured Castellaniella sp.]|uniref:fimbrial biogenesis chaperone n=1 Tax=uncultured Castellaniella sp. TaxID=647907 RepID=UPI00261E4E52|nr:fimbria/pilus periplasmic chaperone [uncultured Castellaniella sp.]
MRVAAGMIAWACAAAATAATLQISPVTIEMAPGVRGAAMTLSNVGEHPLYGQLRVFEWDQREGEDRLLPTRAVVASPPMLQIAPGAQQVVRIVRVAGEAARPVKEDSYRILIDEIPDPRTQPRSGVVIRMRYSVPVFLDNGLTARDRPELSWSLACENRRWRLRADNAGALHARLNTVWIAGADGRRHDIEPGLLGYVLPGRHRIWDLDLPANARLGKRAVIHAVVNAGAVEKAVDVRPGSGGCGAGR